MEKYKVYYGYENAIYSNSRNVRKHLQDLGVDRITIRRATDDKFIIAGVMYCDGTVGYCKEETR